MTDRKRHAPCPHRILEIVNGVALDMCGAICFESMPDLPCEYCTDKDSSAPRRDKPKKKGKRK